MRVIFMGTPESAVTALESITKSKHKICLVVSKPDKLQGKEMTKIPTEVKLYAQVQGIEVFQPEKLKSPEVIEKISILVPDAIVVVAYGKAIPKEILDIPKYGCIKLHNSLLPQYRGNSSIQCSVINGDRTTGVTTIFLDETPDEGDIIMQSKVTIGFEETSGELKERLSKLGAETLVKTLDAIENGTATRTPQNAAEVTYAKDLDKATGLIDWDKNAEEIHNLIRGTNPWPIACTSWRGKVIKIYKSRVVTDFRPVCPGKILRVKPLIVVCGSRKYIDGMRDAQGYRCLEILELSLQGHDKMSAANFVKSYGLNDKMIFGTPIIL